MKLCNCVDMHGQWLGRSLKPLFASVRDGGTCVAFQVPYHLTCKQLIPETRDFDQNSSNSEETSMNSTEDLARLETPSCLSFLGDLFTFGLTVLLSPE